MFTGDLSGFRTAILANWAPGRINFWCRNVIFTSQKSKTIYFRSSSGTDGISLCAQIKGVVFSHVKVRSTVPLQLPPTRQPLPYQRMLPIPTNLRKAPHTVVSKLITDRLLFWGQLISNYRYRIVLPEELISITETDLCEFQQKSLSADTDSLLNFRLISITDALETN